MTLTLQIQKVSVLSTDNTTAVLPHSEALIEREMP